MKRTRKVDTVAGAARVSPMTPMMSRRPTALTLNMYANAAEHTKANASSATDANAAINGHIPTTDSSAGKAR